MNNHQLRSIVIVGGGTAGWMAAATLAHFLRNLEVDIRLVESDEIGTVGVGEATVPIMKVFNDMLGINEWEFVKQTQASFKLGIEFRDWGQLNNSFFHGFGDFGANIDNIAPHHHWLKLKMLGDNTPLSEYSFAASACRLDRFAPPPTHESLAAIASYKYAYHFDAVLYAKFLRNYAEMRGIKRMEGTVVDIKLRSHDGFIESLALASGEHLAADFFIDCSGFKGLLIEQALKTGYEDWSHWLPCNRAVVAPCKKNGILTPYTISTARDAGWQWRIPLQHRVGNGYVYANQFINDEVAERTLRENIEGELLAEPRVLRFTAGHRKQFWNKNCLALGLAGGFMEPLESTSIQLIQTGIARFFDFFPSRKFDCNLSAEYNRLTMNEYSRIRDFLILHYSAGVRDDAELWRYCQNMVLPDTLQHKIDVFTACGRVPLLAEDSYSEASWVAIFTGLNLQPKRYDPLVDCIDTQQLKMGMAKRKNDIQQVVCTMPKHQEFITRFCSSAQL